MSFGPIGSRVGKYEILSEIGQGGMSVVYRARDTVLERDVALKVMHSFLAEQREARARFHREAVAVARLRHPHIIEIYDYSGADASLSYIVTELVDGTALATSLTGAATMPPEGGLVIARAVADALVHAHAQGVIHRDLKPENILIGRDGSLKLTDFGIARMLDNQTLTVTGTLLGSPAYMAPEYIEGAETDARADVYSFGAMLYQFLTGSLPFEAQSPHALLRRIVAGEYTPPEQRNPKVHAAIARVVRRALAREPTARYQSARDLLGDIDQILARLGLDAEAELTCLLGDAAHGPDLERALLPRYVTLGKAALAGKRVGPALEDFDRALSIDPAHAEVRRVVRRLARRALRSRVLRAAALAVAGAAVVTFAVGRVLDGLRLRAAASAAAASAAALAAAARTTQNVAFIVQGQGDLYVDGALVQAGVSVGFAHDLPPGEHVARLAGAEHEDTVRFVVPAGGPAPAVRLDATRRPAPPGPRPPPGRKSPRDIEIRVAAGLWVNVFVDGDQVMREHLGPVKLSLAQGSHVVRFSNPCCEPEERVIRVSDTEPPEEIEPVRLKPSPARLFIEGAPPGARVEVAGKREYLRPGEPVFVPMTSLGPSEHRVVVVKGDQVVLAALTRFEPGKALRLSVPGAGGANPSTGTP